MVKKFIGVILLLVGGFFGFAPHTIHVSFGFTLSHMIHVTSGIVMLILGAGVLYLGFRKDKTPNNPA